MTAETNSYIEKAYERLTCISADEEKRLEYEAREKAVRDYNYLMRSNWREGHEEGIIKGRKEGLRQGHEEGVRQGFAQGMRDFVQGCQNEGKTREEILEKLESWFHLSQQEALEYMQDFAEKEEVH